MSSAVKKEPVKTVAKVAPAITKEDVFADDRVRVIKEHQAKNPDFIYMWELAERVAKEGPGRHKEVVKGVENGTDVLCRMPKATYNAIRTVESKRSFESATKKRGLKTEESYKTGKLNQTARPVTVKKKT